MYCMNFILSEFIKFSEDRAPQNSQCMQNLYKRQTVFQLVTEERHYFQTDIERPSHTGVVV